MKRLLSLIALLAALSPALLAQLEILIVRDGVEQPAGGTVDFGAVPAGGERSLVLRLRNPSDEPLNVTRFSLAGTGFSLSPALVPFDVRAHLVRDFLIRFRAGGSASYSANLEINQTSIILLAQVPRTPDLSWFPPCRTAPGETIDFGTVAAGQHQSCTFHLTNPTSAPMTVTTLSVEGAGFLEPVGIRAPLTLQPDQTVAFTLRLQPPAFSASTTQFSGSLRVDSLAFRLTGQGIQAPLPPAILDWESSPPASAQQRRLTVRLAEAAPFTATGRLAMTFEPDASIASGPAAIGDDPTVRFVLGGMGGTRDIQFDVVEGQTQVLLDGEPSAVFQTGTTAGRIRFTLSGIASGFAPGQGDSAGAVLIVPPATVHVEVANPSRRAGSLDLQLTGYDNTYTAGSMSFTFFDAAGVVVGGGPIRSDFTQPFRSYFTASQMGSAFEVVLRFPITGDSSRVGSVEVEFTNAAGTSRTGRLTFP